MNTGKGTRGIYRYVLQWVAEEEACKLQKKADAIGRPVTIRAVKTNERRRVILNAEAYAKSWAEKTMKRLDVPGKTSTREYKIGPAY